MSESIREQIIFNPFSGSSVSNRTGSSHDNKASHHGATVHLYDLSSFSLMTPGLHRFSRHGMPFQNHAFAHSV